MKKKLPEKSKAVPGAAEKVEIKKAGAPKKAAKK